MDHLSKRQYCLYLTCTDLQYFRSRGVIREQIQRPLDDIIAGTASLVVLWLLPFTENLDAGITTDLHTEQRLFK